MSSDQIKNYIDKLAKIVKENAEQNQDPVEIVIKNENVDPRHLATGKTFVLPTPLERKYEKPSPDSSASPQLDLWGEPEPPKEIVNQSAQDLYNKFYQSKHFPLWFINDPEGVEEFKAHIKQFLKSKKHMPDSKRGYKPDIETIFGIFLERLKKKYGNQAYDNNRRSTPQPTSESPSLEFKNYLDQVIAETKNSSFVLFA